ncbi:MAG: Gfo/Idh/MocA family oxidoreductase [Phycisphaerales bacterium]|nr:Gfo/Idh/MocA family oxidoreductase [Phycisphaerales bacterium]
MTEHSSRREFLKTAGATGLSALTAGMLTGCGALHRRFTKPGIELPRTHAREQIRIGFVGLGGMGSNHIEHLLRVPGATICAVCDIVPEKVARIQDLVEKTGQPRPTGYSKGDRDFVRLCETEQLDIVYNAAPWEWHVPICVAAMRNGKHAATEVPAALTADDCWKLVEYAEKFEKHCVMLENCNYGRFEMMVFNMVRKGVFGEIVHAEVGYQHDLRAVKFDMQGEGLWRRAHATKRDGNFYPTHGLGPAAQAMDINRGDQFDYLVSMSGNARGLALYAEKTLPPDSPLRSERYKLADVNTTLIRTVRGRTIYVVHDTHLPRPYARFGLFQGTNAIYGGHPPRVHIEGRSPGHDWEPIDKYADEFEHPLWRTDAAQRATGGHGGMDYLENLRLIQCLQRGEPTDMNVYDAAAISCVVELTARSVAKGSEPVSIPDFTRGRWRTNSPLAIVNG